ncbi:MAG: type III pantothenate kinase, partial [Acidaminococcaceae bacterium]|nr:type III pantothenate kinase [Acidaminococcaceae bacterium]
MLLVIDVGNTNVVAGVYADEKLLVHWRFASDRSKTADEYGILLSSMFAYTHVDMMQVNAIIISTVVPPLLVPLCNMCK